MKRLLVAALDFGVRRPLQHLAQRRVKGCLDEMTKHARGHATCDFNYTCPTWTGLLVLHADALSQLAKVTR